MRKADRDLLQQHYRVARGKQQPSEEVLNNLWNEWKNPASAVRPFYFSPHEEWGIHIMVEAPPFFTIGSAANLLRSTGKH